MFIVWYMHWQAQKRLANVSLGHFLVQQYIVCGVVARVRFATCPHIWLHPCRVCSHSSGAISCVAFYATLYALYVSTNLSVIYAAVPPLWYGLRIVHVADRHVILVILVLQASLLQYSHGTLFQPSCVSGFDAVGVVDYHSQHARVYV